MNFKKKIQTIIFLLVIGILLISPAVYWLSRNGQWINSSILEERKLIIFPKVPFNEIKSSIKLIAKGSFLEAEEIIISKFVGIPNECKSDMTEEERHNKSFQCEVNLAAAEQMLARIPLVELSKSFERLTIRGAYLALPDQALPASFDSGLFVARDGSCLMQDVVNFTEVEKAAVDARIANYQELLQKHPDIYFYVFNIETLPYSAFHPAAAYFPQADSGRSLAYFLENKPAALPFENFTLAGFRDYQEKFFKTDQHWNIRASLEAYRQIYAMFKEQYPDISPMLQPKYIRQVEGLEFYGSLARKSLYPVPPDTLEYTSVGKLDYITFVDGVETKYGGRDKYLSGAYNQSDKFENHYRGFYGVQKVLIQYHFNNDSQRNLLMITSSYSRTIQLYLAAHFHDTYIIDLRFEEDREKSLKDFIDQYQITDVLVLGQPSVTYSSAEDAIKP